MPVPAGSAASPVAGSALPAPYDAWRHRWALLAVAATLVLIFIGGLVTSTGSGLSVPDWPLSYGMLMPPMVGGIFYEHGHRIAASTVGFMTLVLAFWTAGRDPRRGVRRLAWGALAAVVAQGVLGGLTVIYLLPTAVSVAHACLAQAFFCLLIALAYATSREWISPRLVREDFEGLGAAGVLATAAVFLQLALGAVMRHTGAGLAIPDFPLAFGHIVPPLDDRPVIIHFAHRVGAVLVLAAVMRLFLVCRRTGDPRFAAVGNFAVAAVFVQLGLGAATVLTAKDVLPTTAHVTMGAAILGLCWFLTLRAFHLRTRRDATALSPAPAGHPVPSR